jgi:FKBP-type peptidyl-prolyl cis-trans isomerase
MSGEEEKKPTVANLYAKQKEWGNDISRERNKGLFKRILKEGSVSDKPVDGSKVEVHYVGRLLDGTVFDSSRERETTFEFVLGTKSVIKGWEEGVKTMNRGEVCLLTCKPEYAYGEKGSPPKIPANATLQFEVELIQWKGEDITPNKDGGVRRLLLKQDTKPDYYMPKEGAEVKVHVQGKYKENVFEDRDVTFVLGEGSENNVVEALEIAIMQMRKGQCYHLDVLPRYAYGDKGNADFGIPPGAELEYQVELHQFEKMKEPWDYENVKERIAEADHVKERGTMFFKESKFDLALKVYKRAFGIVEGSHIHREEDKEACKGTVAVLRLNMALCHLKLENGLEAREECEKVLEVDKDNIKALFRKGQVSHVPFVHLTTTLSQLLNISWIYMRTLSNASNFHSEVKCVGFIQGSCVYPVLKVLGNSIRQAVV